MPVVVDRPLTTTPPDDAGYCRTTLFDKPISHLNEYLNQIANDIRAQAGSAVACLTDVTRLEDLERLVATAVEEFGRLDVLVSNAGISKIGPMSNLDVDGWSAMIDVNLRGVLHGITAALPVFQRQAQGHFVTIVSTAGLRILPTVSVYAATKNAVRTVMEGLRQESTDGAIRTTSISPGFVRTELDNSIDDLAMREHVRAIGIPPESVANAVAFVIEQPPDVEIGGITIPPTLQG